MCLLLTNFMPGNEVKSHWAAEQGQADIVEKHCLELLGRQLQTTKEGGAEERNSLVASIRCATPEHSFLASCSRVGILNKGSVHRGLSTVNALGALCYKALRDQPVTSCQGILTRWLHKPRLQASLVTASLVVVLAVQFLCFGLVLSTFLSV